MNGASSEDILDWILFSVYSVLCPLASSEGTLRMRKTENLCENKLNLMVLSVHSVRCRLAGGDEFPIDAGSPSDCSTYRTRYTGSRHGM